MTGPFHGFTCALQKVEYVTCKPYGYTSGMHLSCGCLYHTYVHMLIHTSLGNHLYNFTINV